MARSSILGGERVPVRPPGHDTDALGPSDSSDSGSDVQGGRALGTPAADADDELTYATATAGGSDTDSAGTGERGSAVPNEPDDAADIVPDRIETGAGPLADDADEDLDDAWQTFAPGAGSRGPPGDDGNPRRRRKRCAGHGRAPHRARH